MLVQNLRYFFETTSQVTSYLLLGNPIVNRVKIKRARANSFMGISKLIPCLNGCGAKEYLI